MDMNQFTQKAREALQAAQRIAVEYSNNTVEHLFGILSGMCATLPHPTWMSLLRRKACVFRSA